MRILRWTVLIIGVVASASGQSDRGAASPAGAAAALPADIYPPGSVASVSGMSGTGAGIGTIAATYLTGIVADHYSFGPILVVASIVPLIAAVAILKLIRIPSATTQ